MRTTKPAMVHTFPSSVSENHYKRHRLTTLSAIGQVDDHATAKEVVAGLIGAFVDREVETKGLDFIDREKAKRHAQDRAERQLAESGRW